MSLLFDAPLIAGLRYQEDVLTAPQEADLIHRLRDERNGPWIRLALIHIAIGRLELADRHVSAGFAPLAWLTIVQDMNCPISTRGLMSKNWVKDGVRAVLVRHRHLKERGLS